MWGNKFWKSGLLDAHFAAGDPRAESSGLKGLAGGFPGYCSKKTQALNVAKGNKQELKLWYFHMFDFLLFRKFPNL